MRKTGKVCIGDIWQLEEIKELHKQGRSYELCFLIDCIYNSCQKSQGKHSRKSYTTFIEHVKEICLNADNSVIDIRDEFYKNIKSTIDRCFFKPRLERAILTPKAVLENMVDGDDYLFSYKQMAKRRICISQVPEHNDDIIIPIGGNQVRKLNPGNIDKCVPGSYIVYDRNNPCDKVFVFDSFVEANKYKSEAIKKCVRKIKLSFAGEQTCDLVWPNNKYKHVKLQDLLDDFMFQKVSFYGLFSRSEKENIIRNLYNAFNDLSICLKCTKHSISFKGSLSIAVHDYMKYGTCAYCDTSHNTIVLDSSAGGGNIAHEWFHYLDYRLSGSYDPGAFASEKMNNDYMNKLLRAVKFNRFGKESKYYKSSVVFDKNISQRYGEEVCYWGEDCEMLARLFAMYVRNKTPNASCFLVRKNELHTIEPGISNKDRGEVFYWFDALIKDCFAKRVLIKVFC